jgi:hypothetical protein
MTMQLADYLASDATALAHHVARGDVPLPNCWTWRWPSIGACMAT